MFHSCQISDKISHGNETSQGHYTGLQYALYSPTVVLLFGVGFFFLTAFYIESDKKRAEKSIHGFLYWFIRVKSDSKDWHFSEATSGQSTNGTLNLDSPEIYTICQEVEMVDIKFWWCWSDSFICKGSWISTIFLVFCFVCEIYLTLICLVSSCFLIIIYKSAVLPNLYTGWWSLLPDFPCRIITYYVRDFRIDIIGCDIYVLCAFSCLLAYCSVCCFLKRNLSYLFVPTTFFL